jgi:putative acetyltransferase
MIISTGDLGDARVVALLRAHVDWARAVTPPGSAHALDLDGLRGPDIGFWAAWEGEALLGVGALKRLSATHGEVKSMHTAAASRGRGVASAMLVHIVAAARAWGLSRLSLETGSFAAFESARALYARHGFVPCGPFGDYVPDPNSVFRTMKLNAANQGIRAQP